MNREATSIAESIFNALVKEGNKICNRRHTMFSEDDVSRMTVDELVDVIIETATIKAMCHKEADTVKQSFLGGFEIKARDLISRASVNAVEEENLQVNLKKLYDDTLKGMKEYLYQVQNKGVFVTLLRNKAKTLLIRR